MTSTQEFVARHKYARMGVRKARLTADMIRGKDVNEALRILEFSPRRASAFYLKVLKSATANASQDEEVNVNRLYVSDARADDGPLHAGRLRWRPGPQGRAMPYRKRTCHLTVRVSERVEDEAQEGKGKSRAKAQAAPEVEAAPAEKPKRKTAKKKAAKKAAKKTTDKAADEPAADAGEAKE